MEIDDISTFMGPIPPQEYELRSKIRSARNMASYMVTQTESGDARQLCWMVCDWASAWIYMPASTVDLESVAQFLRRLLICANQAANLEAPQ